MVKKPEPKIIRAVLYCRKSTDEERAEKSIKDQKARIEKLVPQEDNCRYEMVKSYTKDRGVPGWKRGSKRPDYHRIASG